MEILKQTQHGQLTKHDDTFSVAFQRHLNHPIQRVWQAITDPAKIKLWLAEVEIELREGGRLFVQFTHGDSSASGEITEIRECSEVDLSCKTDDGTAHGSITELQENAVLEYSWQWDNEPVSIVRWELQPITEDSCQLTFSHRGLTGPIPSFSGGWHTHLELLEEVLDGTRHSFGFDFKKYEERFKEYERVLKELE